MSENQKTRKVIAKGVIGGPSSYDRILQYDGYEAIEWGKIPHGTKFELIILIDPEKKPVPPEGVSWKRRRCIGSHADLIHQKHGVIATITSNHLNTLTWETELNTGYCSTLDAAQLAAEHALADAELYGFKWVP